MQSTFWKLAALATVMTVGLVVMVQAQKGLTKPVGEKEFVRHDGDGDSKPPTGEDQFGSWPDAQVAAEPQPTTAPAAWSSNSLAEEKPTKPRRARSTALRAADYQQESGEISLADNRQPSAAGTESHSKAQIRLTAARDGEIEDSQLQRYGNESSTPVLMKPPVSKQLAVVPRDGNNPFGGSEEAPAQQEESTPNAFPAENDDARNEFSQHRRTESRDRHPVEIPDTFGDQSDPTPVTIKPRHTEPRQTEPAESSWGGQEEPQTLQPAKLPSLNRIPDMEDSRASSNTLEDQPVRSVPRLNQVPSYSNDSEPAYENRRNNRRNGPIELTESNGPLLGQQSPELSDRGTGVIHASAPLGPQKPELRLEKRMPAGAQVGQEYVYKIVVQNVGKSTARKVVVEDFAPAGSRLEGTSPPSVRLRSGAIQFSLNDLPPNSESILQIKIVPETTGKIGSVATVSFAAEVAADIQVAAAPQLRVELVPAEREVVVGEKAHVKYRVTNIGGSLARGVVLRTVVPQTLNHPVANDLEYEIGELQPGRSKDVELALQAVSAGPSPLQAMAMLNGAALHECKGELLVIRSRLDVERDGPASRLVNSPAVFTNRVRNVTNQPMQNVLITEKVPQGLELVGKPDLGRWNPQTREITWLIPRLGPQEVVTLNSNLVGTQTGTLRSTVTVTDALKNRAEYTADLKLTGFSALEVEKQLRGQTTVQVGEQVSMRFVVKNHGSAPAERVEATIEVPAEMELVGAEGPGKIRARQVGNLVHFEAVRTVPVNGETIFDVAFTAKADGDSRVKFSVLADDVTTEISRSEQVRITGAYANDGIQRTSGYSTPNNNRLR